MLERPLEEHQRLAERLLDALQQSGIDARVIDSAGQCGGGTLPDLKLPSAAVEILPKEKPSQKSTFAERVFQRLLEADAPVLGVLREGRLLLDVLTVFPDQIDTIVTAVGEAVAKEARP